MVSQYLKFKKWVEQKKIQKRLDKFMVAWIIFIAVILIGLLNIDYTKILGISAQKEESTIVFPTPTTHLFPTDTPIPTVEQVYVDPDPIIDCESSYPNCKGSSIRVRQSQCSKITCCGFNDNKWVVYPSNEKCDQDQTAESNQQSVPQATQNSPIKVDVPFYCKTVYGEYLATSAEECNKTTSIFFNSKIKYDDCMKEKQKTLDSCQGSCESKKQNDNTACNWAYSGVNATLGQDYNKWSECTNEVSNNWSSCISKCTDDWSNLIKACSSPQ